MHQQRGNVDSVEKRKYEKTTCSCLVNGYANTQLMYNAVAARGGRRNGRQQNGRQQRGRQFDRHSGTGIA